MPESKNAGRHELCLTECQSGEISGVKEVLSFDTETVRLETVCGRLQIRGHDLHVSQLSLETGHISISGTVDSVQYMKGTNTRGEQKKLWQRMFR